MFEEFIPALRLTLITFLLCGLLYPLAMTGLAHLCFPYQANGSLIVNPQGGVPLGSALVGQRFDGPEWFHGRVSSIAYQAEVSGASNYGPTNKALFSRVKADIQRIRAENPGVGDRPLPADLLTQSGSGLDPHISVESARLQVPRVARSRGIAEAEVLRLVDLLIETPDLGIFGMPRVNVLKLNLALISLR